MLDLLKPRVKTLDHLVDELRPFLVDEPDFDTSAAEKHLTAGDPAGVDPARRRVSVRSTLLVAAALEQAVRGTAEHAGVKAAALIHATRVAVTGRAVSAGLFELLALLGRDRVMKRLLRAVTYTPPS